MFIELCNVGGTMTLVCFIGLDGSGKTTIAHKLTKYLKNNNFSSLYVYGRFKLIITKLLVFTANKVLLKGKNIQNDYVDYTKEKNALFCRHRSASRIYLSILLLDYLLQLQIKVRLPLILGKVVVCDRYIFDTIITDFAVDMKLSKEQIFSLIDKCFLIVPRPNITYLVDIDEETAYSRKNDIPSKKYLEHRRHLYLNLTEHYDLIVLNGKNPSDEVFSECLRSLENEFCI
jgi:dTMP kinase